jgi:hypothetical protein
MISSSSFLGNLQCSGLANRVASLVSSSLLADSCIFFFLCNYVHIVGD